MNGFMVDIENYIFLHKEESFTFPKMYNFPGVSIHPFGCNQNFVYFPQISQYVSTLFSKMESNGSSSRALQMDRQTDRQTDAAKSII